MNLINGNFKISVAHFSGKQEDAQDFCYNFFKNLKIKKANNLAILLVANKEHLNNSQIVKQLNYNHIPFYYNKEAYDTKPEKWDNTKKCYWISEELKNIKEEYTLILDVRDIVLTGDLDNNIIEALNHYNGLAVYNTSNNNYPNTIYNKTDISEKFKFRYLNGGVCIGYTKYLQTVYSRANELQKKFPNNKSEQFLLRQIYNKDKNIKLDYERRYFAKLATYQLDAFKVVGNDLYLKKAKISNMQNPIIASLKSYIL